MRINALDVKGALDKNQQLISAVTIVLTQTQTDECIRLYSDLVSVFISVCNCCGVARDILKD